MTDSILALVPTYGLPLLFIIGVLAAIGIPLPSTLTIMAVGAFVAGGDLNLVSAFATALIAAVTGDQIGYQIGLHAGNQVEARLGRKPSSAAKIAQAKKFIDKFGGVGVFLTRWLLAPIGPTTNIVCGASDMRWIRFSLWGVIGEITWVSIYLSIGYIFHGDLEALASMLGEASWALIAGIAAIFLGKRMVKVLRTLKHEKAVE